MHHTHLYTTHAQIYTPHVPHTHTCRVHTLITTHSHKHIYANTQFGSHKIPTRNSHSDISISGSDSHGFYERSVLAFSFFLSSDFHFPNIFSTFLICCYLLFCLYRSFLFHVHFSDIFIRHVFNLPCLTRSITTFILYCRTNDKSPRLHSTKSCTNV